MEFRHLVYMLKVAEERSFSKAAQKLYITQPSLSQYILNLEHQLNVQLFDRTTNPIKLTYAGEIFAEKARNILSMQKELTHQMEDIAETRRGRLNLGITPHRGTFLLPKVLPIFYRLFPQVEIKLMEGTSAELEDWLVKGIIDLAVMALPIQSEDIAYEVILSEELLLTLPSGHPVQARAKYNKNSLYPSISLNWLKDEPFILLHHGQGLRQIANEVFRKMGFTPRILLETKSLDTANALVAAGLGVTFSLASISKFSSFPEPPMLFSLDDPVPPRILAIAFKQGTYLPRIAVDFIKITKDVFQVI
ncbi:MAG: LysR family transcriptional regulator [Peptococcaceae bacterium]|nr:LysR family transcriptional regulator [Peptococcaceae bacterium]